MHDPTLIAIQQITKFYGGVTALGAVSFEIAKGEVHALCGENGAGKSTLNKILSGSLLPDSGEITVENRPLPMGSVQACQDRGISIVHQESTAFLHLNAIDNIFVGRELTAPGWGFFRKLSLPFARNEQGGGVGWGFFLDRRQMERKTRELMLRLGESLPIDVPLLNLTTAQRQMVSIARALARDCRLLIMDEPTSSLSAKESAALFRIVRQLRSEGVSILWVTHRLDEVFELADRVTVLRDGKYVGTRSIGELDRAELIRMMVGREMATITARESNPAEIALTVKGLSGPAFQDVNLTVRAGEIVALAGLVGAGRSELARAIAGIDSYDAGTIEAEGRAISYVPEDRQHQGLALPMSIRENLTLSVLPRIAPRHLLIRARENQVAQQYMQELDIRADSTARPVESLSGGNQQKVLLGKWLATDPQILILDEPTRGIDVGAKAEIHRHIRALADRGVAILLISSEMPEVLDLADRIIVLREGQVAGELSRSEATQEKLLALSLPDESAEQKAVQSKEPIVDRLARQREIGVGALVALTLIVVSLVNPRFLSIENLRDLLINAAPIAIAACGMTLVILAREIDISIGSLMGLSAAIMGIIASPTRMGGSVPLSIALALATGLSIGLLNGALVAVGRVPSIIVTLGMLTILRGGTDLLMRGQWITDIPPGLRVLGTGSVLGVPISLWTAAICLICTGWLLARTALGRRIVALGSNPQAAVYAGISPTRIRLFVFACSGLLTAIATLVSVTRLSTIESGIGVGFELLVVTCVVVGGTSIRGGQGSVLGSFFGTLLLGSVATMLIFLRLGEMSTYWERAIQGAFILAAVMMDNLARRRAKS